jgi:acyl-CoA synthetase (AMP-forming)/AMP-acid ligase II
VNFLAEPWHDDRAAILAPTAPPLTYRQLEDGVAKLAGELADVGVGAGQRVALVAPNTVATLIAVLALWRTGAAVVPLNPALIGAEMGAALAAMSVERAVWPVSAREDSLSALEAAARRVDVLEEHPPRLADRGSPATMPPAYRPDAMALLLQTSGTTGKAKVVPIRQQHLTGSASTIAGTYRLDRDDVGYGVMPLFHVHGLVGVALASLTSGGAVVLGVHPAMASFWDDALALGVTWLSAVPTILARVPLPGESTRSRLRFVRSASSALPPILATAVEAALGVPVVEAYGMTECTHQLAANPLPPGEHRFGTVGVATNTEIRVVDDDWDAIAPGSPGEVTVRGPNVVDGYLDNPEATAASFRDGWFRTGDLGVLSGDGYLTLVGRIKELINRAGEKIAPREVDDALLSHPAVVEAAAYGVPDGTYGEVVHAAVVTRGQVTEAELIKHCRDQVARFKVPVVVHVVETIPKGPTGKVQRSNLAVTLE